MDVTELKVYLYENPSLIEVLLDKLDCHHIKHIRDKRIQCALPDGDNTASVQVLLGDNSNLMTVVHTRKDYNNGDIIHFVQYIKGFNFRQALNWMAESLEIGHIQTIVPIKRGFLSILHEFDIHESVCITNDPIPETAFSSFIEMPHRMFSEDGISADVQKKMRICYDIEAGRVLIPIRNEYGELITFKGRTTNVNYKSLDIPKYLSYYNYNASSILYGLYENHGEIMRKHEVIVVESEKAVLQAMSIGIKNVVAISKNTISKEQVDLLLGLQCDVVLALDKDIEKQYCIKELEKFGNLCRKYLIHDEGLLEIHDSPFDKGDFAWGILYDNKIKVG